MFTTEDEREIRERLSVVTNEVKLILFTQKLNCETCPETEMMVRALAELSEHIKLEVYKPVLDEEKAKQYRVTEVPTIVVEGDRDYGIRYLGAPMGYEFACLLEDIISVGRRDSGLSEASRQKVQALQEPLNLKVFSTPG